MYKENDIEIFTRPIMPVYKVRNIDLDITNYIGKEFNPGANQTHDHLKPF